MDKYKIHKAVEYIRTRSAFPFDGMDVEDSLEEVLSYFGLHPQLDEEEKQVLREDLLPLAWGAEEAEIAFLAEETRLAGLMLRPRIKSREERCTPEGVHLLSASIAPDLECTGAMRQGVSPLSGENAP